MMSYRVDFYTKENIIGYTGLLAGDIKPSIYFYNQQKFHGHITQVHNRPANIGRTKVFRWDDYLIFNSEEGDPAEQTYHILGHYPITIPARCYPQIEARRETKQHKNAMFEYGDGRIVHVSRNPFVSITPTDHNVRENLASMIGDYPKLKSVWDDGDCCTVL